MNPRLKRRTQRVMFRLPLVVSVKGKESHTHFQAETMDVNREGAKIRSEAPLEMGFQIRIAVLEPYRSAKASVVWISPKGNEYGIELENPGNFWGIAFPPDDWKEPSALPESLLHVPVTLGSGVRSASRTPGVAPSPEIPMEGASALVTGVSSVRVPFQESARLMPHAEGGAIIMVKPSLIPGTFVRVIVGQGVFTARIKAVSSRRMQGKWKLWLQFN
ncbi:MAG TPA: PilZ domain-containing protein [Terriglobales bacterium]|nr:PilZ domain-containing protein [Terriglobales bacterium]